MFLYCGSKIVNKNEALEKIIEEQTAVKLLKGRFSKEKIVRMNF